MKGFLFTLFCCARLFVNAQLVFSNREIELGTIPEAYEIRGNVVVRNTLSSKIFLLRADAETGVKIYTSKKTLAPGDTCLLVISFLPETKGRFQKSIRLVSSDQAEPHQLSLSGYLSKVKSDDKTACYYFGEQRRTNVTANGNPIITGTNTVARDNSNKMPDQKQEDLPPSFDLPKKDPETKDSQQLPINEFKPNNVLFLVDVSGSMKDSLKLPLMKRALHTLIDAVREVDRMTFVTYADTVKIIKEGVSGSEKKVLHDLVDALKTHGLTKGNKAILFSQVLAQKYYIRGGNNQILLATDGKFSFSEKNFASWNAQQGDKRIVLSTVAFGDDKSALKNLKEIAVRGEGSFIHIRKRHGSEDKLLEELKKRSRIQ